MGAVGAAILAAFISLVGLILGKEQKTSEFRQAWIDALRADIVLYSVSMNAIVDKLTAQYASHDEKLKALSPHYADLNRANLGILLRVNPGERFSKTLIASMRSLEELAADDATFTTDKVKSIENCFTSSAQNLLKHEWKRVKAGELAFRVAKWGTLFILALLIGFMTYLAFTDNSKSSGDGSTLARTDPSQVINSSEVIASTPDNKLSVKGN
jgi:hypothetical protein